MFSYLTKVSQAHVIVCLVITNDTFVKMWKEAVVIYFKVLLNQMFGGKDEISEKYQPEQPTSGPRIDPETCVIHRSTKCISILKFLLLTEHLKWNQHTFKCIWEIKICAIMQYRDISFLPKRIHKYRAQSDVFSLVTNAAQLILPINNNTEQTTWL
jgi:hypothetical protein